MENTLSCPGNSILNPRKTCLEYFLYKSLYITEWFLLCLFSFVLYSNPSCRPAAYLAFSSATCVICICYNVNVAICPSVTLFLKISKLISQQLFCPPELPMPCDQYELHLENSVVAPNENQDVPVASLDQSTSIVTAVQLGHINVVLDHKSILLENHSAPLHFF